MKKGGIGAIVFGVIIGLASTIVSVTTYFNYFTDIKEEVLLTPASEEGVCLTDAVDGQGFSISNISTYFKDACVSIILTNGHYVAWGSGVCVASIGYEYAEETSLASGSYIVTNHHVVSSYIEAQETVTTSDDYTITVYPNNYDADGDGLNYITYDASLLWADSYLDMAIIYVEESIDWVKMKDRGVETASPSIYEGLFCIGSPYVEGQGSTADPITCVNFNNITTGKKIDYINGAVYTLQEDNRLSNIYENMLVTNIEIHGGNSGGGLFDKNGYLIGQPTLSGSYYYSNAIYPYTLILKNIITTKEAEETAKRYNLASLNFNMIDSYESSVMGEFPVETGNFNPNANKKYFYGGYYTTEALHHTGTGLKVISSSQEGIAENDVVVSVTVGDVTTTINYRQELIYILIQLEEGNTIIFNFSGTHDPVTLTCQ